jgi:hypothetical protein
MKTAVLLDDTNISDMNYHVMSEMNNAVENDDVFLLVNNVSSKVIHPNFAVINSSRVACVEDGLIVATNLNTALMLRKVATNAKKVYYMYNIDWCGNQFNFDDVYDTLHDPNLIIICRSDSFLEHINAVYKTNLTHVLRDFDLGAIWNLLEKTLTS